MPKSLEKAASDGRFTVRMGRCNNPCAQNRTVKSRNCRSSAQSACRKFEAQREGRRTVLCAGGQLIAAQATSLKAMCKTQSWGRKRKTGCKAVWTSSRSHLWASDHSLRPHCASMRAQTCATESVRLRTTRGGGCEPMWTVSGSLSLRPSPYVSPRIFALETDVAHDGIQFPFLRHQFCHDANGRPWQRSVQRFLSQLGPPLICIVKFRDVKIDIALEQHLGHDDQKECKKGTMFKIMTRPTAKRRV